MIPTLPSKQPNEKWYIPFDFSNPLNSQANPDRTEEVGEISEVSVFDITADTDVTETMADLLNSRPVGQMAYVWITGGEDGHRYKLTCRIQTLTSKQEFEMDCYLPVREE